jgi:acyl-CoA synthetase (AMP-forming)/AMP-acid ligase II
VTLHQTREAAAPIQTPVDAALDSVALIFTTSGTTGTPKLIPVTHENLLVTADKMRQWFNLSPDDRTAFVLPSYYGAAIKISFLAPLLLGGGVGLPTARHVEDLAEWVPKLRPTWLWGNPTFFQAVLDGLRAEARPKLTHSLRFVVSGTAHLPPRLRTELEATLGVPVLQSYGMSEAGILAADPAPPAKRKPGTTGLISRHELAIIGPNGDVLPDGEVGEIVVHGLDRWAATAGRYEGVTARKRPCRCRARLVDCSTCCQPSRAWHTEGWFMNEMSRSKRRKNVVRLQVARE